MCRVDHRSALTVMVGRVQPQLFRCLISAQCSHIMQMDNRKGRRHLSAVPLMCLMRQKEGTDYESGLRILQ
jgi:hypothetical protein